MSKRKTFASGWMTWSALVPVMMLSTCLGGPGGSGMTERTICRELHRELPSYSAADTDQTVTDGADFLLRFQAACAGYL